MLDSTCPKTLPAMTQWLTAPERSGTARTPFLTPLATIQDILAAVNNALLDMDAADSP